ncbi:F-box/FBD/LRR-repeat protein At5g22660-like [Trifolium pratense]|uniref:F-box/FBD/LRR-repeat protein At5g22660-like n=1 Tax=Trifolium pratense TaxID=57577 RepID=UPI001E691214|nr:F-box/FBD/LRR-repeat protein At5g22660-like [Trifolium pratense]
MFEKKKIEEISSSSMVSIVHLPPHLSFERPPHKRINIDMISYLPDNVLNHILSFLSTEDAIKTSILSTKWRYLWTYLSVFDFYSIWPNRICSLLHEITTLIDKSNHHQIEIKRLTIRIPEPEVPLDAHKVASLVTSLLTLKIIDLQFRINGKEHLKTSCMLPRRFSPSYSLTKLHLHIGGYALHIPNGIHIQFPSLKTLNLSYATFENEESVEQFFSGFPVLEELTLYHCYWLFMDHITIAISTLRMLTIHVDPYSLNDCNDNEEMSLKIDCVNLLSLTCISDPTIQFVIVKPPTSLLDAYIAFSLHSTEQYMEYAAEYVSRCAVGLLSGLASVKSLTLSEGTFIEPPDIDDHFHLLPKFHNLTHLCLHLETNFFTRKSFMQFLLRCPKLEVLAFPLGYYTFKDNDDWALIPLPCCFKSSLKKLHITNFDGFACEIQFVEFFLENATVLEEFQISLSCSRRSKYNSKNLADLKNRFVGMGSCDIQFRSSEYEIKTYLSCEKCCFTYVF